MLKVEREEFAHKEYCWLLALAYLGNMNVYIARVSSLILHTLLVIIIKNNAAESTVIATLLTMHVELTMNPLAAKGRQFI